ncbi:WhiB family transcriptional regulator [Actinokineospora cianjurensis]|uniref:WhiB family redox-sensing transcriptional regulator n=1 Tax=Actinokineospora cianjurensis TaxID=585224 RepID=A0A421B7F4_9PSEU|nr:WhiB family transcriptional regulator [Actinokineospora cianjurensis]RLK60401.1 WhiB family redox-sensing transcriptional regulator [Actinokineospora cianjurensis]
MVDGIAWRLDRLRWVPTSVLDAVVRRDGDMKEPDWSGTDREVAARLCAECPVRDECLELELRTAGEATAGVFGGLGDEDRRALYPHWLRRGERVEREPLT